MQKRGLLYLAIGFAVIAQLSGCTGTGAVKLPSGDQVAVTQIGKMYFSKGSPALTISFNAPYDPRTDFHSLQREADELFAFEQEVIDASHLDVVILRANHKTGGSTFVWTARGYDFVYHKTPSSWCRYQPDRTCEPFLERGNQVDAFAPRVAAEDSALAALITERYEGTETAPDSKAFSKFLAPGFVEIDIMGQRLSAAQVIQMRESRPRDPLRVAAHTVLTLTRKANTLVVQHHIDMKTIKPAAGGKKLNVEFIWLTTDTWVNLRGNWFLLTSEADQLDYYLNGRQIDHLSRP